MIQEVSFFSPFKFTLIVPPFVFFYIYMFIVRVVRTSARLVLCVLSSLDGNRAKLKVPEERRQLENEIDSKVCFIFLLWYFLCNSSFFITTPSLLYPSLFLYPPCLHAFHPIDPTSLYPHMLQCFLSLCPYLARSPDFIALLLDPFLLE